MAKQSKRLSELWSKLEKRTEEDVYNRTTSCSLNYVANLADEAYEVWEALEYWATYPLNSQAKDRFESVEKLNF